MKKKSTLIISIIMVLLITYISCSFAMKDKMVGGMTINGINCSFMEYDVIDEFLEKNINMEQLKITSNDEVLYVLDTKEYCTYDIDVEKIKAINESIPFIERLLFFVFDYENNIEPEVTIDEEALNKCLLSSNGTKEPENAYIKYVEESSSFEIIPEVYGDILDTEEATRLICENIANNNFSIDISKAYIMPGILSDNEEIVAECNKLNEDFNFSITYIIGENEESIEKNDLLNMFKKDSLGIPYVENNKYVVDKEKVDEFIKNLSKKYNTINNSLEFKTTEEEVIKIDNGSYGYEIDVEKETEKLTEDLTNKISVKRSPIWLKTTFNDTTTNNGIGNTYVEVSKEKQHLWFYKDGELIIETDVVTGNYGKTDTDNGIWAVMYKTKGTYLTGPTWKTWVDYWMPFNSNGEGLHDASWRKSFGKKIYKGNGSHGCVNLPPTIAKEIYQSIEVGTPVIIY